jgi:hypothetical protein
MILNFVFMSFVLYRQTTFDKFMLYLDAAVSSCTVHQTRALLPSTSSCRCQTKGSFSEAPPMRRPRPGSTLQAGFFLLESPRPISYCPISVSIISTLKLVHHHQPSAIISHSVRRVMGVHEGTPCKSPDTIPALRHLLVLPSAWYCSLLIMYEL